MRRQDLSGMLRVPQKNSFSQHFFNKNKKKKEKHRLKNSVKLPQHRIIPSSAINSNSLVSCV